MSRQNGKRSKLKQRRKYQQHREEQHQQRLKAARAYQQHWASSLPKGDFVSELSVFMVEWVRDELRLYPEATVWAENNSVLDKTEPLRTWTLRDMQRRYQISLLGITCVGDQVRANFEARIGESKRLLLWSDWDRDRVKQHKWEYCLSAPEFCDKLGEFVRDLIQKLQEEANSGGYARG